MEVLMNQPNNNNNSKNIIDLKSKSWHWAKIALIASIILFIAGIPLYVVFIGTGGEPIVFLMAILLFSLTIAAVISFPIYFISFRKNKNWLNITGLIANGIIICLTIILLILFKVDNMKRDYQFEQASTQSELKHSQWINSAFNESESKLETYYNIHKKYPANFCDANNDSNLSCGELDVNDNDTQQHVNFTGEYWKSLIYIMSESGRKYELCADFSQSCVFKIDNKRE